MTATEAKNDVLVERVDIEEKNDVSIQFACYDLSCHKVFTIINEMHINCDSILYM